jgi:hypothetical protein
VEDTDYIYALEVVKQPRPRAPKDWRCLYCHKGDTQKNPAYEYDISTASAQPMKVWHHPACIEKHWEKEWADRPPGLYAGAT